MVACAKASSLMAHRLGGDRNFELGGRRGAKLAIGMHGHGALTDEQIADLVDALCAGKGRAGSFPAGDLALAARSIGQRDTKNIPNMADSHGSDKTDFPALCEFMAHVMHRGGAENDTMDAFRAFDPDGNGFVSVADVSRMHRTRPTCTRQACATHV